MKILNKERTRKWLKSKRQAYIFSENGRIPISIYNYTIGMKPKLIKNPKLEKIRERIKKKQS